MTAKQKGYGSIFTFIVIVSNLIMAAVIVIWVGSAARKPVQAIAQRTQRSTNQLCTGRDKSVHGIVFGRTRRGRLAYSPSEQEGHVAVFGGTGSGKTSAILVPTLRHWSGTCFVIDISGDIHGNVDAPDKLIYAPGDPQSAPYDVFGLIDSLDDEDAQNEALSQLAYLLIPDVPDASANAQYFQSGGRKILTAALIAYYHKGADFVDICRAILNHGYQSLFAEIDRTGNQSAIMYISGFEGNSPQNIAGCKDNCDDAIRLFGVNQRIGNSIRRSALGEVAFTPQSIEIHNIFVVLPDAKLSVYSPLLRIITAQILTYLADRPAEHKQPVLLCLDEFASLGKLHITAALRKLRKKHVRIMLLTQSIADIEEVYGRDRHKVMLDNCSYIAILGVTEPGTAEFFAKMIGREQKLKESVTSSEIGSVISRTRSTEKDYIIAPADLAHLGNHLLLLHPGGFIRLQKAFYFK